MLFFVVLVALCMGSFGNVLIDRLPAGRSIAGRSRCDGCNRALRVAELVPLLSWLWLRGRCRTCKARIPVRVPAVELGSAVLGWIAYATFIDRGVAALPFLVLPMFLGMWALLLIAVIDLRTRLIPDLLTAIVFAAGLFLQWFRYGELPWLGPVIGVAFFGLQWLVSRGRWIGSGDILLAGAIGALVGTAHGMVWVILLAYITGSLTAVGLLATKRLNRRDMIPFGPFLVLAALLVLLLGDRLPPLPF